MVLNALFIYTHYPVKIPSGSLHWPVDTLTYELVLSSIWTVPRFNATGYTSGT